MLGVTPPPPNQDALRDHSVSESICSGHRELTCLLQAQNGKTFGPGPHLGLRVKFTTRTSPGDLWVGS